MLSFKFMQQFYRDSFIINNSKDGWWSGWWWWVKNAADRDREPENLVDAQTLFVYGILIIGVKFYHLTSSNYCSSYAMKIWTDENHKCSIEHSVEENHCRNCLWTQSDELQHQTAVKHHYYVAERCRYEENVTASWKHCVHQLAVSWAINHFGKSMNIARRAFALSNHESRYCF